MFQSAPRGAVRVSGCRYDLLRVWFRNPRPPRGDVCGATSSSGLDMFPNAPRGWRAQNQSGVYQPLVSIRPRALGETFGSNLPDRAKEFQSTPPRGKPQDDRKSGSRSKKFPQSTPRDAGMYGS